MRKSEPGERGDREHGGHGVTTVRARPEDKENRADAGIRPEQGSEVVEFFSWARSGNSERDGQEQTRQTFHGDEASHAHHPPERAVGGRFIGEPGLQHPTREIAGLINKRVPRADRGRGNEPEEHELEKAAPIAPPEQPCAHAEEKISERLRPFDEGGERKEQPQPEPARHSETPALPAAPPNDERGEEHGRDDRVRFGREDFLQNHRAGQKTRRAEKRRAFVIRLLPHQPRDQKCAGENRENGRQARQPERQFAEQGTDSAQRPGNEHRPLDEAQPVKMGRKPVAIFETRRARDRSWFPPRNARRE